MAYIIGQVIAWGVVLGSGALVAYLLLFASMVISAKVGSLFFSPPKLQTVPVSSKGCRGTRKDGGKCRQHIGVVDGFCRSHG
jgi:hypothetical protein